MLERLALSSYRGVWVLLQYAVLFLVVEVFDIENAPPTGLEKLLPPTSSNEPCLPTSKYPLMLGPTSPDPLQARKAVLDIQGPSTATGRLPQKMPAEARPTTGLRSTQIDQIPFTENRSRFSLHPPEHSRASKLDAGKDAQGSGLYAGSFPKD